MKLYFNQLQQHLQQQLAPVYLVVGDEPLQLKEATEQIRAVARAQGFSEREVLHVDKSFDWGRLRASAGSMSLFAEKRLIELLLPDGQVGRAGSAALVDFIQAQPDDVMLMIRADAWTAAQDKSKWVQSIATAGVFMRVYLPRADEFPRWLATRCRQLGLNVQGDALGLLASRLEGNLLAAAQELEKLRMRFGAEPVDARTLSQLVADNARFDVFRLSDALVQQQAVRCIRILRSLRRNDLSPVVIVWALDRELRLLYELGFQQHGQGQLSAADFRRRGIWADRQKALLPLIARHSPQHWLQHLNALARIDRVIKGRASGDEWIELERWVGRFCQAA